MFILIIQTAQLFHIILSETVILISSFLTAQKLLNTWYLFQSVHTEHGAVMSLDSLHEEHVPPYAYVARACARKHHLLRPAVHGTHHSLCLPHVPLAPN